MTELRSKAYHLADRLGVFSTSDNLHSHTHAAAKKLALALVNDQVVGPSFAVDIAEACVALALAVNIAQSYVYQPYAGESEISR